MAELKIINLEDVEVPKVNWLWYPYIPFGKITIIQGDPGDGKTTLALRLAALLSQGEKLPEDSTDREPTNIIYQTAEDGIADTVKPRLLDAGADCSKIKIIDETDCALSMLDDRIEQALIETGAKVLILDPIQSYVGSNVNMNTANEVRSVMSSIGRLAEKYNEEIRVVAHGKSSLAPEGDPIAFELNKETGFKWLGYYDISLDDLLSGVGNKSKTQQAENLLLELLEDSPKKQSFILNKANAIGISKRTLDEAKKNLDIKSVKENGYWYWKLG